MKSLRHFFLLLLSLSGLSYSLSTRALGAQAIKDLTLAGTTTNGSAQNNSGAHTFLSGASATFASGSTLTLNGALTGTPTGGTLNLSALTLTLPATVSGGTSSLQPLDSDLTAIAALTTTANGRSLLASTTLTLAGLGLTNGATLDTIGAKTQTGMGNLVLATSPTLTAPNIGAATGTSVNLTGAGTFGGNVSADGQSGYIGQATTSSRYFDVGSTTNNTTVGYNLGILDGSNNYRSSLFLDDATGITGINLSYSSGTPKFQVQYAGVSMMELTNTSSTFSGTGTHLFSGYLGLAYAGTQKWHLTADASNNLVFTRSGVADRMTLSSDGELTLTRNAYIGNAFFLRGKNFAGNSDYRLIGVTASNTVSIDPDSTGVTFAGSVTANGQLIGKGTTTNDNAATGYIGEYVSSTLAAGSAVSLTTATAANITSLSLTAGDWDVTGLAIFSQGPSTVGQQYIGSISTTTGTVSTTETSNAQTSALTSTSSRAGNLTVPTVRVSIASTTTLYLVAKATFTTDTMSGYGTITARRQRRTKPKRKSRFAAIAA